MTPGKIAASVAFITAASLSLNSTANAYEYTADETDYPVIFAHGMAGWDSLAGYHYFGEDGWGTFVGDACSFMEMNGCNDWISQGQQSHNKAEAFQVTSLNSSEVRGEQLYNHARNFMATTGYTKVNFVGHSQGGFDIRKAAHRLKDTSINGVSAGTSKVFNQNYGINGVAGYVGSIITGQDNGNLGPILALAGAALNFNADGDGYCTDDCNNDGSAGQGDGNTYDMDDDGLVGINSQQMGYRLKYTANDCAGFLCFYGNPLDWFNEVGSTGYVADLNNPSATQMTSHDGRLSQDHLDVISIGPDGLDEEEFYAAIFDFIEAKGY